MANKTKLNERKIGVTVPEYPGSKGENVS